MPSFPSAAATNRPRKTVDYVFIGPPGGRRSVHVLTRIAPGCHPLITPFAVRLRFRRFRMPDFSVLLPGRRQRRHEWYRDGADLVAVVVSEGDPDRDWVTKKAEYAAARIPEYWIADPRDKTLTVLTLDSGATEYREAGRYGEGQIVRSLLLDGVTVGVAAVFEGE